MENLQFFLVSAAVFALILGLAVLAERHLCKDRKQFSNTHYISYTAIFSAISGVLMLMEIPLFSLPPAFISWISAKCPC